METKRIFLSLALLSVVILAVSCTDHLDVQGLPTSCKDQNGNDVKVRVEMKLSQNNSLKAVDTFAVSGKGDADFMIGAETQKKSLLAPGHRPTGNPDPNLIYTADPVSIDLKVKDPCRVNTKTLTVVLDDLPHQKIKGGRVRYTVQFDQFKP